MGNYLNNIVFYKININKMNRKKYNTKNDIYAKLLFWQDIDFSN